MKVHIDEDTTPILLEMAAASEADHAAKDAEIERLQEYVMGKATIATKDLLGKLQAAEAEVARLKDGIKRAGAQLQASTRTMDEARGRIVELESDLAAAHQAAEAEVARWKAQVASEHADAEIHAEAADRWSEKCVAAEAEVARLKGINELQADLLNGAIKRARDERERCARVAEEKERETDCFDDHGAASAACSEIAAAIRAG